jgi:hypothetical protein
MDRRRRGRRASDEEIEPARQVAFAQYAPGVEA